MCMKGELAGMPKWMRGSLCAWLAIGLLAGCAAASAPKPVDTAPVEVWLTTADHAKALSPEAPARFGTGSGLARVIEVDAGRRYQRMLGFGAAITDASAWLIQHRMDPKQREALLQELFGPPPGIGLSFARLTIGASDFSRGHYSLNDLPAGKSADPDLAHFSITRNLDDVVPVTRVALAVNPKLKIMASPWSAPA